MLLLCTHSQSCNVTGNMDVCCTGGDVVEVLQMLSEWHCVPIPKALRGLVPNTSLALRTAGHLPPDLPLLDDQQHVLYPMQQALLQGGQCDCCLRAGTRSWERVVVITPCLHLLCVEHAHACGKPGDAQYGTTNDVCLVVKKCAQVPLSCGGLQPCFPHAGRGSSTARRPQRQPAVARTPAPY